MNLTRNKIIPTPCYQCEDRYVGCHGVCEDYIEFDKHNKRRNAKHLEEMLLDASIIDNKEKSKRTKRHVRNGMCRIVGADRK